MANSLTPNQIYTLLNSVAAQATGNSALVATDTSSFVTVADTTLKAGYDSVINAISVILNDTVFSIRPYWRKFKSLETDAMRFGNHVRKLNIADKDWETDDRFSLVEGQSVDPDIVSKPVILQTNYYGQEIYARHITYFKDQIDCAMRNETELGRFWDMVTQNTSDIIEQGHESLARMTVVNAIAGVLALNNTPQIVHLLTEYNTASGQSLTSTTVYEPDNFKAFIQWAYARMAAVSEMLTERSIVYHNNIVGKEISRHTPKEMQKAYIYAPTKFMIDAMVYANTFNEQYLKGIDAEVVNYWQSIDTPDSIAVTASYTGTDGEVKKSDLVEQDAIFAIIYDQEAMGYTTINQWSAPQAFNSRGGYQNVWYHWTDRYYVDNTENMVLFLLD